LKRVDLEQLIKSQISALKACCCQMLIAVGFC
jgi:hypothetical protein